MSGTDPGYLDGPPPAPAHRGRSQGERSYKSEECYTGRCPNSAAADNTQQNREPTASAEARSTLRWVRESANAYAPLKSVANDLCFILDHCEVCPPSRTFNP